MKMIFTITLLDVDDFCFAIYYWNLVDVIDSHFNFWVNNSSDSSSSLTIYDDLNCHATLTP